MIQPDSIAANVQIERERLLQAERVHAMKTLFQTSFVRVWECGDLTSGFHIFSCLIPLKHKERFLKDLGWDYRPDDLKPRVECVWRGAGKQEVYYLKHGNESGAEPLYHLRSYDNHWTSPIEIVEEFRLFFNLFQRGQGLLACDVQGNEEEVVRVKPEAVEIKLDFLARYLRAKQMHLAVQFDGYSFSTMSLVELGLQAEERVEKDGDLHFEFSLDETKGTAARSRSRLIGKVVLPCPGPIQWQNPYNENEDQNSLFIVGIDAEGKPVERDCHTGTDRQAQASALTRVFFRREVLLRYFNEPDKYTVQDGRLSCGALWGLRMDNDHMKYVVVFLKDLELLPPGARGHWKGFNTTPDGGPSDTFVTRNIRGWFASPKMPDLVFKRNYPRVNEAWQKRFGWPLWREPAAGDEYVIKKMHVCFTEEQAEFDEQNTLLAKLLVDFLNEGELERSKVKLPDEPKGIDKFEDFVVRQVCFADGDRHVASLRDIQRVRSKSIHRKNEGYQQALHKLGVASLPRVEASSRMFQIAIDLLAWLEAAISSPAGTSRSP